MMKKWLLWLAALLLLGLGQAAADGMYIDGRTADRVHLRVSPMADAESLGLFFTGTPVERIAMTDDGWTRVQIGSHAGYVRSEYLAATAAQKFPAYVVDNRTSDWVNLRSGASFEANPVGRLENGDAVRLMGETASGWSYVTAEGRRGYVVTEFLSAAPTGGQADVRASSRVVGVTEAGDYILAVDAGSGQTVYLVSQEEQPLITREDVNFDGYDDLVITTARGATNFYYAFFVWTSGGYVRAGHPGVEGIANYALHPERGMVTSSANAGSAGALYEDCIFTWDGTDLHLIRHAQAANLHEYRTEGTAFVTVMYDRKIDLTVYAYDAEGGMTLIHSEVVDMNRMDTQKLEEMKQRLWEGLR